MRSPHRLFLLAAWAVMTLPVRAPAQNPYTPQDHSAWYAANPTADPVALAGNCRCRGWCAAHGNDNRIMHEACEPWRSHANPDLPAVKDSVASLDAGRDLTDLETQSFCVYAMDAPDGCGIGGVAASKGIKPDWELLPHLVVYREWKQVELRALAERQLASFMPRGRIRMEGPDLMLNASDAQSLGMALQELLTNSVNYGAMSNGKGKIALGWAVNLHGDGHQHISVRWIESGGPPVQAPVAKGFGTRVLERFAEHSLEGRGNLEFAPEGLRLQASWRNSPLHAKTGT